jgi:hypothetical protein
VGLLDQVATRVASVTADGAYDGVAVSDSCDGTASCGDFSLANADQAERDHDVLKAAVRKGKVTAYREPDCPGIALRLM